eukprot:scaffold996_cov409-Prasinococcus_capsulatus_cf.AAC.12
MLATRTAASTASTASSVVPHKHSRCAVRCAVKPDGQKGVSLATAAAAVAPLVAAAPAWSAEHVASVAELDATTTVLGGVALTALASTLISTDPEKRRQQMTNEAGGDEMESVKNYFNTKGFDRWNKIYGETDDVNKVQLDIREGHAQTVEKVLSWVKAEGNLEGTTVCDAGCGTGSLSIPLAQLGFKVSGSDISSSMAGEADRRAKEQLPADCKGSASFETSDLESLSGKYHTVACLDVMIHYPQDKANGMVKHLASLASDRVIISFAPYTLFSVGADTCLPCAPTGELFPGPSKATRAYLHPEEEIEKALNEAGWKVVKREMTATSFYFSRLLEAVPAN